MKIHSLLIAFLTLAVPLLAQTTLNCSIPNSAGIPNGTQGCICLSGFAWNGTACVVPPAATATTTTTTVTTTTPNSAFNCASIPNAGGPNGTSGCVCNPGYVWVTSLCFLDCSLITNAVRANSGVDSCICQNGFVWNVSQCSPISAVAASLAPGQTVTTSTTITTTSNNGTGTAGTGLTSPAGSFSSSGSGTAGTGSGLIMTTTTPNPSGTFTSSNTTAFVPGTTAVSTGGTTAVGSGGTTISGTAVPGVIFVPTVTTTPLASVSTPVPTLTTTTTPIVSTTPPTTTSFTSTSPTPFTFPTNPTGVAGATGLVTPGTTSSTTTTTTITSPATSPVTTSATGTFPVIGLNTIDCRTVINSTGFNNGPNACFCVAGHQWSVQTNTCGPINVVVMPVILVQNCSQIKYSSGNTSDPTVCACKEGYNWFSGACVRNCSNVNYSNGTNINNGECYCNPGSTWNGFICNQNCTGKAYVVGNDNVTGDCMCIRSFKMVNTHCELDCSKVIYGTSKIKDSKTNTCECRDDYRWDGHIFQCVSDKDWNKVALGLGLGIPLGLLALAGLGYWLYTCNHAKAPVPVQQPVARTEQVIAPSATSVMDTERALNRPTIYPTQTTTYQYGARGSGTGGMIPPPPVVGPVLTSPRGMQGSAVMAGPPPPSLLPNQSNLGVMTTTTQRAIIEPTLGQAYNAVQGGFRDATNVVATDVYNTAQHGMQGAYNAAQSSAQNFYGQARDGANAAAADMGRRLSGS